MDIKQEKQFGTLLVEKALITQEQLEVALQEQESSGERLGQILLRLGLIKDRKVLTSLLAEHLGVDFVHLKELTILPETIAKVPAQFASFYKIIPVAYEEDVLSVATENPQDIDIVDGISLVVPFKIKTVLADEKEIQDAIRRYYGVGAETIDRMMDTVDLNLKQEDSVDNIEEIDSEASIGKFINQILLEAYQQRATDIHIEPFDNELSIRYRVDGVLKDAQVPANIWHFKDSINSRIKIMSRLNIAEKRMPQDGRFQVKVGNVDLDMRVSFLPTQYGESVVLRLLSSTSLYDIKDLGMAPKDISILEDILRKPHGIVFLTGPTGSGKTTTLYSCLSRVNKADKKIITIEDPVEYQIKGIVQMQIHPTIGLTFARGLRSMLRHDPDIMMIGEVRDLETAEIAIQIALTGHLVFSTLHTNDAASGIARLIDMGVEPYLIASSVECFIAQRLVRLVCPRCKVATQITLEAMKDFGFTAEEVGDRTVYHGKGCEFCNDTGYHGRHAIYEFLVMNDAIRELMASRASAAEIKKKAVAMGMTTLLQSGWEKVKQGLTTPSEVIRVIKEETS